MANKDQEIGRRGRFAAMVIAGTAVFWIIATLIGGYLDLTNRMRALFDLLALAGFIWALVLIYQIWRMRQDNQG
jgi:MFS family permease